MSKKNCEICGTELTDSNRSKSYRNRCKECVAKQTAQKRASKASVKSNAQERTEKILQKSKLDQEIEADVIRFISHESMRQGVKQDRVISVIKGMNL